MIALANRYKVPLLVVSVPANYTSKYNSWIQDQARQQHISLLDCSQSLPPYEFTGGVHLTASGHRRFAEDVAAWLKAWWADPTLGGQMVTMCPSHIEEK
jgi:lysophospholipase L1-like esterase